MDKLKPFLIAAAAFGRLCVETRLFRQCRCRPYAAAFGRLCVETLNHSPTLKRGIAAAFGRLCVETCLCLIYL